MRKIEIEMLAAARAPANWSSGNTAVVAYHAPDGASVARVYLHGNHIADVPVGGPVKVNVEALRRWPTRTTVSRLRTLGADAQVKGGLPYLNGVGV